MLVGFRLVLRSRSDGRLSLTIPLWYRLLLAAIGALILVALVVSPATEERRIFAPQNTLALIITGLALLGAMYRERWIFDKAADSVIHQFGLVFAHGNRRLRMSELGAVVVERFVKGRLDAPSGVPSGTPARRSPAHSPMLALSLRAADGRLHRLESYAASQGPRLESVAGALSAYCGLPREGASSPPPPQSGAPRPGRGVRWD